MITRSNAAEREASGRKSSVWDLGVYLESLLLHSVCTVAIYLLIYGTRLFRLWMTPVYADRSGPLLPILVPAIAIVMAGNYNSSAILFGLARINVTPMD